MQESWTVIRQVMLELVSDYFPVKQLKINMSELIKSKVEIQELIQKSGVFEYTRVIMKVNQLKAIELMDDIGIENKWKEKLLQFI